MKPKFKDGFVPKTVKVTKRKVNVGTINIRRAPDKDTDNVLTTASKDEELIVLEDGGNGWSKVQKGDTVGYTMSQYLS